MNKTFFIKVYQQLLSLNQFLHQTIKLFLNKFLYKIFENWEKNFVERRVISAKFYYLISLSSCFAFSSLNSISNSFTNISAFWYVPLYLNSKSLALILSDWIFSSINLSFIKFLSSFVSLVILNRSFVFFGLWLNNEACHSFNNCFQNF